MLNPADIKILRKMSEHVMHIDHTIRVMTKYVHAWLDNDRENMDKTLKRVKQSERDANKDKLVLYEMISQAQASMRRSDFIRLTLRTDMIADIVEGVSSRISRIKESYKPDENLASYIKPLLEAILNMGGHFKSAIKSLLEGNIQQTPKYLDKIDSTEEMIDTAYRNCEAYLFDSDLDIKLVLQIRAAMYQIEEAGDRAHYAADHIRILLATL
ncbi:MAG: DUF47 family protein [Candidatus Lokiarchaeota archaeon]|nr:DUF47 family protein [Candidatus Lokiarchaeota archaeon]